MVVHAYVDPCLRYSWSIHVLLARMLWECLGGGPRSKKGPSQTRQEPTVGPTPCIMVVIDGFHVPTIPPKAPVLIIGIH